jgi:hypothetical protein
MTDASAPNRAERIKEVCGQLVGVVERLRSPSSDAREAAARDFVRLRARAKGLGVELP